MTLTALVLAYLLCSALAVLSALRLTPFVAGERRMFATVLYLVVALAMPFIGVVLIIAYAATLRRVHRKIDRAEVEPVQLPPAVRDFRLQPSAAAPGGIAGRLAGSRDPEQRVAALSQIVSSRFFDQYRLLRAALKDEAEEVRLLAYAALDQREHENTELLISLRRQIDAARGTRLVQRLRGYHAWLQWSIDHSISREMADPRARAQGNAGAPAPGAGRDDDQNGTLPLLAGLRHLETGDSAQAVAALLDARRRGVGDAIVAPYLAAAYYADHDIPALRRLYADHPELVLSSRYGPSHRFWVRSSP
jgi:hypothetical protein|nr:putative inner membrane exopolysaccharide export protein PelE [uncultured Acidithrix sp.]